MGNSNLSSLLHFLLISNEVSVCAGARLRIADYSALALRVYPSHTIHVNALYSGRSTFDGGAEEKKTDKIKEKIGLKQ